VRFYNICVLTTHEVDNPQNNFVVSGEQINFARALTRLGGHSISEINCSEIYKLNGPLRAVEIIDAELRKNNADIVLFYLGCSYHFPIEFFAELRKRHFMIAHVGDDEHYFDKNSRYYAQGFDLVCATSRPIAMRHELYGIDTMVFGSLFDLRKLENISYEKVHDVGFVGTVYEKVGREKYLKSLLNNGINTAIFGEGTHGGMVPKEEMSRIYGSSKIGLSLTGVSYGTSLDRDITINRRCKQIKGRSHEIAMTGTFVLSEYALGIEDEFEIGKEIDVFHCEEELISKVKYYLEHDAVREEIALNGYNRVLRDYDEVNGWKKIMSIIDKKLENKKNRVLDITIYKDPIFKRAFSAFHLFKMFKFMMSGMPKMALHEFSFYAKYPLFDSGVFIWNIENYAQGFLGNIQWLRSSVRKLKRVIGRSNANKI
jgi:hypothetical protein